MTRILIADDHHIVRSGLRAILEQHEGWEVVAEAQDGRGAIEKAIESRPDVAIVDYSLPGFNGIEATRQIRAHLPEVEILIFTMHESDALIGELLKAGARGYLLKSDANQCLVLAVEALANHRPFFTNRVSEQLLNSFLTDGQDKHGAALSPREALVLRLIAEGHGNKDIGKILNLSPKTIESHRAAVMRKLKLPSTAALVRYAIRNKLVEP